MAGDEAVQLIGSHQAHQTSTLSGCDKRSTRPSGGRPLTRGRTGRREQAKGATFFSAVEGETVRPMLDVCWAPMLGAVSVLFEEFHDNEVCPPIPTALRALRRLGTLHRTVA